MIVTAFDWIHYVTSMLHCRIKHLQKKKTVRNVKLAHKLNLKQSNLSWIPVETALTFVQSPKLMSHTRFNMTGICMYTHII